MDIILTNSKNTQARIQKYLWLKSYVVYPPVDSSKFRYISDEGYFLSFARLADAKRVDKIVEAFIWLPHEKLIVIYGKNDPQKEKIINMAHWYPHIQCITLENNDELYSYIGKARATIYIPIDEDFGMSPVESMSAWKPVLWVNEGGLKESIIHKETWFLLRENFSIDDIREAVSYLNSDICMSMSESCTKQAELFSLKNFDTQLHLYLSDEYKKKHTRMLFDIS